MLAAGSTPSSVSQRAAAGLVLVQRFVPAPSEGQAAHAAAVRLFQPGLQPELQARGCDRLLVVSGGLEGCVLRIQDLERQPVVVLLPVQHPRLESLAVGDREAGQEVGAERLGQELQGFRPAAPSGVASEGFQLRYVEARSRWRC